MEGEERDNKQIYVQVINLFLTFLVILSISEWEIFIIIIFMFALLLY